MSVPWGNRGQKGSDNTPKKEPARAQGRETGCDGGHVGSISGALGGEKIDLGVQMRANEAPNWVQRGPEMTGKASEEAVEKEK